MLVFSCTVLVFSCVILPFSCIMLVLCMMLCCVRVVVTECLQAGAVPVEADGVVEGRGRVARGQRKVQLHARRELAPAAPRHLERWLTAQNKLINNNKIFQKS